MSAVQNLKLEALVLLLFHGRFQEFPGICAGTFQVPTTRSWPLPCLNGSSSKCYRGRGDRRKMG